MAQPLETSFSRLNAFQLLACQWDQVHPYNAAQVMKIAGAPDRAQIHRAWHDALEALGLGRVHLKKRRFHYQCLNGQMGPEPVCILAPGVGLDEWISREMNRPFNDPTQPPFRAFVIVEDQHYYAGIVYQHWVADSVSIRMLMREWFMLLHDSAHARSTPVQPAETGYLSLFGPHRLYWRPVHELLMLMRRSNRFRRVRKVITGPSGDYRVRFAHRDADTALIGQLRRYARDRGVTINTVFLAALAETCGRYVPTQERLRRSDVALGSVVDLRPYSRLDLSNTFGLFLGFSSVVCRPQELSNWDRLLQAISHQTSALKAGIAQHSLVWLTAALYTGWHFRGSRDAFYLYRKFLPLTGGISNVNLTETWTRNYPGLLLDYLRASPTGPIAPVVFTPTTCGNRFGVGLTYRSALINDELAQRMLSMFLDRLEDVAATATASITRPESQMAL